MESEFFGHEAGAFTGATGKKIGKSDKTGTKSKVGTKAKPGDKKPAIKDDRDEREKWADKINEDRALRLSKDGEELYSFGPRSFQRNLEDRKKPDPKEKGRTSVSWAKDSSALIPVVQADLAISQCVHARRLRQS